jgi:transcriptional regulator with XRE-family HTH domain
MGNSQDEKENKKLGETFKKAREKMNLTQMEVAEKTDMTVNYYAMIERGEVNPSISMVRRLKKLLKINPSEIF